MCTGSAGTVRGARLGDHRRRDRAGAVAEARAHVAEERREVGVGQVTELWHEARVLPPRQRRRTLAVEHPAEEHARLADRDRRAAERRLDTGNALAILLVAGETVAGVEPGPRARHRRRPAGSGPATGDRRHGEGRDPGETRWCHPGPFT